MAIVYAISVSCLALMLLRIESSADWNVVCSELWVGGKSWQQGSWDQDGAHLGSIDRSQVGPMWATWSLLYRICYPKITSRKKMLLETLTYIYIYIYIYIVDTQEQGKPLLRYILTTTKNTERGTNHEWYNFVNNCSGSFTGTWPIACTPVHVRKLRSISMELTTHNDNKYNKARDVRVIFGIYCICQYLLLKVAFFNLPTHTIHIYIISDWKICFLFTVFAYRNFVEKSPNIIVFLFTFSTVIIPRHFTWEFTKYTFPLFAGIPNHPFTGRNIM